MQVDASKIEMFVPQFHVLWDGMFQIVGYMAILYTLIGWPCFAGLVIMVRWSVLCSVYILVFIDIGAHLSHFSGRSALRRSSSTLRSWRDRFKVLS